MPDPIADRQITGDDIISELIRNVDVGSFKIRYTTLVPCVFNVYLHADDYEQVGPIADFIRSEARQALSDHLSALNKPAKFPALARVIGGGAAQKTEFKILEPDWTIEFHRDTEERLRRGDIEIYSELGSTNRADIGAGAKTTFITRRPAEAGNEPVEPVPQSPAGPVTQSGPQPPAPSQPPTSAAPTARTDRQIRGYLRYSDEAGEKTFPITRDQTVIGRGGKAYWVDLKVEGPPDISREHCRLRFDPSSRTFYIKDVSQFGTVVNGERIPSSLERTPTGEKVDRNLEVPLPGRASISLADAATLEFESAPPE